MKLPWRQGLLIIVVLAALGVVVAWYRTRTSAESRFEQAQAALERRDRREVERLAGLLTRQGQSDQAHFLRGALLLDDARGQREDAARLARHDQAERVLRFAGDNLAWACLPHTFCPPVGLHHPGTTALVARRRPAFLAFIEARERADSLVSRAQAELEQVGKESPLAPEASALLGECRLQQGDLRGAVEAFRLVIERRPEHSDARRSLADAYYQLGDIEQAIAQARVLAQLEPDDGYPQRLIAVICRNHRRFGEARKAYGEALNGQLEFGLRVRALKEFAEMLIEDIGDLDAALKVLDRCPETHRRHADVLVLRAECLWAKGQRDEARELVDWALRAEEDHVAGLLLRGRMHLDEDQPRAALVVLKKAVALAPHDFRGRDQLARAYRQLGDVDRAAEQDRRRQELVDFRTQLTVLNRKAAEFPRDGRARFEIASVYLKMDRPQEARHWLKATLACDPENLDARKALRKLDGISE